MSASLTGGQQHPDHRAPLPGPRPDEATAETDRVTSAMSALENLAERPLVEHVEAYTQLHERLLEALAEIDTVAR